MKNTIDCGKNLNFLLRKYKHASEPAFPDADDPVAVLVMSFLLWESTTDKALAAYDRLRGGCVDFNEIRACLPFEVVELLGQRYPRVIERAQRMRAALTDIFNREHAVSLERLRAQGKREAKTFLDSLEGMVPFVSARVLLLCFDSHLIPADDQLAAALTAATAAEEGISPADLVTWLARHVKADDGRSAHFALQKWMDTGGRTPAALSPSRKSKPASSRRATKAGSR